VASPVTASLDQSCRGVFPPTAITYLTALYGFKAAAAAPTSRWAVAACTYSPAWAAKGWDNCTGWGFAEKKKLIKHW